MALSPPLSETKIVSSFWNTNQWFVKIEERESLLWFEAPSNFWTNEMFQRIAKYFYLWLLSSSLVHLERHRLVFLKRYNWEGRSWNWSIFSSKEQKKEREKPWKALPCFSEKVQALKVPRVPRSCNWIVFSTKMINWPVEGNLILFYENKTQGQINFPEPKIRTHIVLTKKRRILSAWTTQVLISSQIKINRNKNVGHL